MKRRSFLRGLLAAPLVAAVAAVPLPVAAAPVPPLPDPAAVEAARQQVFHEAWGRARLDPPMLHTPPTDLDWDALHHEILRESMLQHPALLQVVIGRALDNRPGAPNVLHQGEASIRWIGWDEQGTYQYDPVTFARLT